MCVCARAFLGSASLRVDVVQGAPIRDLGFGRSATEEMCVCVRDSLIVCALSLPQSLYTPGVFLPQPATSC